MPENLIHALRKICLHISSKNLQDAAIFKDNKWECIITLSIEAEQYIKLIGFQSRHYYSLEIEKLGHLF